MVSYGALCTKKQIPDIRAGIDSFAHLVPCIGQRAMSPGDTHFRINAKHHALLLFVETINECHDFWPVGVTQIPRPVPPGSFFSYREVFGFSAAICLSVKGIFRLLPMTPT